MRSTQDRKHAGRLAAWSSAAVLVAGSVGVAAPTFAAQPDNPSAQGQAQSQAHSQPTTQHATADQPGKTKARTGSRPSASHASSQAGHQGSGSGVSLDRPNDFQAQADPDGMENGGVDQPGGTGGIDTTTQDGNNGSGNDVDCEDDNRGVGVPGHCKERPAEPPAGDEVVPSQGGVPDETVVPSQDGSVAGLLTESNQLTTALATAPTTSLDTALVSTPTPRSVQTSTQVRAQAAHAFPAAGVLPNTGAGQALLGLAIAALAALALGGGLVRQGRRTVRVVS
jgi:LPXTG-motif cell wall-anchored protein